MARTPLIRTMLEWSLCLLLIPAGFVSVGFFFVGITFGFNLWRPDRGFAICVWLAIVAFPVFVAWALARSFKAESLAVTARLTFAAWAFAAFAVWDTQISHFGW